MLNKTIYTLSLATLPIVLFVAAPLMLLPIYRSAALSTRFQVLSHL